MQETAQTAQTTAQTAQEMPTAAERAQRGRERLAMVQARISELHSQQRDLEARQAAASEAVRAAQRAEADASAAVERLEQEAARTMVAQLLTTPATEATGATEDAEGAATFERERAACARALAEAQHGVAVAQKAQEADARRAQREAAKIAGELATQERLAAALREAIAAAHLQAGADAVAALQCECDALLERRAAALAEYTAASASLFGLTSGLPTQLAAWPELAKQGADALARRLAPGRDVGEMFLAYCDALQRQAGQDFPALGNGTQTVSLPMTLGRLDAQLIWSLLSSGGAGWRQRLSQIRAEATQAIERYEALEPTQAQLRAHRRAQEERQRSARVAELEREIAREEQLAELQRREAQERAEHGVPIGSRRLGRPAPRVAPVAPAAAPAED